MESESQVPKTEDVIRSAHWWVTGQLGKGELGGNNRGHFVDVVLGANGRGYSWCGLLCRAGYFYAIDKHFGEPETWRHTWLWRVPPVHDGTRLVTRGIVEPGARRLVLGLGSFGTLFDDPELAIPGDLLYIARPGGHHAMMVDHYAGGILHVLEGNVGEPPAPVRQGWIEMKPRRDRRFRSLATLRTL